MKFTSIPQNGSSWYDKLCYAIDTELSEPSDVQVTIISVRDNKTIGRLNLYGVTSSEFDIAPYLRAVFNPKPQMASSGTIFVSRPAFNIKVVANDVESELRTFARTSFDPNTTQLFHMSSGQQQIALGEPIFISLYSPTSITIRTHTITPTHTNIQARTIVTAGLPSDITLQHPSFLNNATAIKYELIGDAQQQIASLCYTIVKHDPSARRLIWFNSIGGLECYTFPKSRVSRIETEIYKTKCGDRAYNHLHKASTFRELYSAIEGDDEIRRLSEIVCSPYIYTSHNGSIEEVDMKTRSIHFNTTSQTRQLKFEIEERQRGGIL